MKTTIAILLLSCLSVFGQTFKGTFIGNGSGLTNIFYIPSSNTLTIDNVYGDDTAAVVDPYHRRWKTVYNITSTNAAAHGAYGAATVARPGDWIVVLGSPIPYLTPTIPLNLYGQGASNGFNLVIMPGATLIHTNFSNSDITGPYHCNLATAGPMIIPGNGSRVLIYGNLLATNDFAQGDASLGWQVNGSTSLAFTGVTNIPPTNVYAWQASGGNISGDADCVYIGNGQTFAGSITLDHIRTSSGWDSFFYTGSSLTVTSIACYGYSGNFPTNGVSHGLSVSSATVYDFGSTYIATGSTNLNNQSTAAINVSGGGRVFLHGTAAVALGSANIIPVAYNSIPIHGNWTETDTNGITASFAETYKFGVTVVQVFTNKLVLAGGGQGGPGNVNLTYGWDNSGTTFSNSATHFVSNSVGPGSATTGTWVVLGGANYRYISFTGFLGPWGITNASTAPAPTADYLRTTNFNVSALGDITQTNFVSGGFYTNVTGRPISVRALGFNVPASVAGIAAIDLQVDTTQSGTFSIASRCAEQTIVGTIVETNYGDLTAYIPTNGVYTFTNVSSGTGNSSGLLPGTGQIIIH